jgi:hypothetical protein
VSESSPFGNRLIGVIMVNGRIRHDRLAQGGGAVRTDNGSAFRAGKARQVREQNQEGELLPWFVGLVVIFAASAVCWALIYAVFMSSYHFLAGLH